MHELSIALGILDVVEEEADRRGGVRVTAVHLKLGPLSGVVKESLLSAFEMARQESRFADCDLIIAEVPVVVYCPQCLGERGVESIQQMCCAVCGTPTPDVRTGRELDVSAMEICA